MHRFVTPPDEVVIGVMYAILILALAWALVNILAPEVKLWP